MKARKPRAARDVAALRAFWSLDAYDRAIARSVIRNMVKTPKKAIEKAGAQ